MKKPNITGFTVHHRETGEEIDAKRLVDGEYIGTLIIGQIENFAFGIDGELYLLGERGQWSVLDREKYDIRWKYENTERTKS